METIRPNKWMSVKTWETLEKECNAEGLTSLLCCQGFNATKEDSFEDNKKIHLNNAKKEKKPSRCRIRF